MITESPKSQRPMKAGRPTCSEKEVTITTSGLSPCGVYCLLLLVCPLSSSVRWLPHRFHHRDKNHGCISRRKLELSGFTGDGVTEWTQVVTSVEEEGGAKIVAICDVSRIDGSKQVSEYLHVSEYSIFSLTKEGTGYRKSFCILLLPRTGGQLAPDRMLFSNAKRNY